MVIIIRRVCWENLFMDGFLWLRVVLLGVSPRRSMGARMRVGFLFLFSFGAREET